MRQSLLQRHPEAGSVTLRELVGIANAIEQEAVRRYSELSELMERRGEAETAEAFRRMQREEAGHVETVAAWAADQDEAVPPVAEFIWLLPPEIAASWDEVASSALLTPYRAFAIAVRNEERAFALYTYLAAQAVDRHVEAEAERLAAEELDHAALLRRWRRRAYHAETGGRGRKRPMVNSRAELESLLERRESEIAGCHQEIAGRLRHLGYNEAASRIVLLLKDAAWHPETPTACRNPECRDDDAVRLLIAAQKPLEQLTEDLEYILEQTTGDIATEAERAYLNAVARLARLRAEIERVSQPG